MWNHNMKSNRCYICGQHVPQYLELEPSGQISGGHIRFDDGVRSLDGYLCPHHASLMRELIASQEKRGIMGIDLNMYKRIHQQQSERKNWGKDVGTKIFYGMIELGEAGDAWKHRGDPKYLEAAGIENLNEHIKMEFIDTMLYCINALYCLDPDVDIDKMLQEKFKVNENRKRIYSDDSSEQ